MRAPVGRRKALRSRPAPPYPPQPSEAQIARLLAEWSIGDGLPRLDAEQVRIVKILVDRFLVLATERGAL